MSRYCIMGLFEDFDQAFATIVDIRQAKVPGVNVDDVTLTSPIEHPEVEEVLGERPSHVQKFTLAGALFGLIFGFIFLAGAQASFMVQPQGGKPVIPLPVNFVLVYEMLIFFAVWSTFFAFLYLAGLLRKRPSLYSEKVSLDQIAITLDVDEEQLEPIKDLFKQHNATELREEAIG